MTELEKIINEALDALSTPHMTMGKGSSRNRVYTENQTAKIQFALDRAMNLAKQQDAL